MRVLVAGWIGSTNLGDELVFAGMRNLLQRRGITPVAVSQDPAGTLRDHGVKAVGGNDLFAIDRAVSQADAMIFGGGGLLQDESSALNLPYHLTRVALAHRHDTPVGGVALGVGSLTSNLGRRLVGRAMGRAVHISVRDPASAQLLAEVGVTGAQVTADAAFALEPPTRPPADQLVVCLRRWGPRRKVKLPAALQGDPTPEVQVEALAGALDASADALGLPVRFVAFQRDRDDALHRRVADRMKAEVSFATPGLDDVFDEVAGSRAVISMRYHGGIAAVMARRPTVLIDYSSKVASLAEELGKGGRVHAFDPAAPDGPATIPSSVEAVIGHADAVDTARERLIEHQSGNLTVIDRVLNPLL